MASRERERERERERANELVGGGEEGNRVPDTLPKGIENNFGPEANFSALDKSECGRDVGKR